MPRIVMTANFIIPFACDGTGKAEDTLFLSAPDKRHAFICIPVSCVQDVLTHMKHRFRSVCGFLNN